LRHWNVNCNDINVSISTWTDDDGGYSKASVASASIVDGLWWVDRVKVHDDHHRQGLGDGLVGRLLAALVGLYSAEYPRKELRVCVCPGGYNTPPEVQQKFYASCGFKIIDTDPMGGVVMEWTPSWQQEKTKTATG